MTSRQAVDCAAPLDRVWRLIARPAEWSRWSPHVRGAEGLGEPEVIEGAKGRVILRGGLRVGAEITAVDPCHSWSWRAVGLDVHHSATALDDGATRLEMCVEADGRRSPLAAAYGPFVGLVIRKIARVAAEETE